MPASLTFGDQNLGVSSPAQALTLTNVSGNLLHLASIDASGDYSHTTTCGTTLTEGAACTVSVTFTPTAPGARTGNLAFVIIGTVVNPVGLSGVGVGPMASLGSTSLAFTAQNLGTRSAAKTVVLNNTGSFDLNIASITASGDYGVSHNCGTGLGVGGFCTLSVTFSPTAVGARTGILKVTDNAYNSPQTIALSGTGQGSTSVVSPSALSFSVQSVGSTSAAKTVTLSNTGGLALSIASIVANGDFGRTTTCGTTLAAGTNCTISVTFTPTMAGNHLASLVVTSDSLSSPNTVSLGGTGAAVALVSLSPSSLSFSSQTVGTPSAVQSITLTNTGGAALNFTSIAATGDFAVTNNCGGGLGAGGSCSLNVTFTPTVPGARTGSIAIASSAIGSPHSINLSGTGSAPATPVCSLSASPASIFAGGSTTLAASCTPAATSYVWTGGTCAGNITNSCTVTPAGTASYTVQGSNAAGNGNIASAGVTVVATPPVFAAGLYDGIYQWSPGNYLSIHQHGGRIIATIYFNADGSFTFPSSDGHTLPVPQLDIFDLLNGPITGNVAKITGTRFHRACNEAHDFVFDDGGNITVTKTAVSNTAAANLAGISCAAITDPVGTVLNVPKILF